LPTSGQPTTLQGKDQSIRGFAPALHLVESVSKSGYAIEHLPDEDELLQFAAFDFSFRHHIVPNDSSAIYDAFLGLYTRHSPRLPLVS
jgi:hypothetical protein